MAVGNMAAVGSTAVGVDTIVVDTACEVESASAAGDIEAIPLLDFGDTNLVVALIVMAIVAVALVDCP